MTDKPQEYATPFDFVRERGLVEVDRQRSRSFGNEFVEYKGQGIRLRVTKDRGLTHVQARGEHTEWVKFEAVLSLLAQDPEVLEIPDTEGLATRLRDHWNEALAFLQDGRLFAQANAAEHERMRQRLNE